MRENLQRIWDSLLVKAPELISLLQAGLQRQEIDEVMKDSPFQLPEEIYELYQWHNGLSQGIELYGWIRNEVTFSFNSLEQAILSKQKLELNNESSYLIPICWLHYENGGDFFAIFIAEDIKIYPVVIFYDDDNFEYLSKRIHQRPTSSNNINHNKLLNIEYDIDDYLDDGNEDNLQLKSNIYENIIKESELFSETSSYDCTNEEEEFDSDDSEDVSFLQNRKKYDNITELIAEIADCCEQGLNNVEIDEPSCITVNFNEEKCSFIHYRHRFAKKDIRSITLEQEAELYKIKQNWLDVIKTPLNEEKATKIIRQLYTYAGEDIPDIIFVPSFYAAHLGILGKSDFFKQPENNYISENLKSLYWDLLLIPFDYLLTQPVITSVLTSLKSELSDFLSNSIEYDLMQKIKQVIGTNINYGFKNLIESLFAALKYDLKNTLGDNFIQFNLSYKYILGNENFISSAALFEFTNHLGVKFDECKLNLFISYCREVGCVIPFDKTILVSQKPQITWREKMIPNIRQQPDISFPDGYSF